MYAVVKTGGKQYRVAKGDVIDVERLPGEEGDIIALEEVLMLSSAQGVEIGAPQVAGAQVAAELVAQWRGDKIIVFKKKRRKHYRRKNGHRQDLTKLRVVDILTDGAPLPTAAMASAEPSVPDPATRADENGD